MECKSHWASEAILDFFRQSSLILWLVSILLFSGINWISQVGYYFIHPNDFQSTANILQLLCRFLVYPFGNLYLIHWFKRLNLGIFLIFFQYFFVITLRNGANTNLIPRIIRILPRHQWSSRVTSATIFIWNLNCFSLFFLQKARVDKLSCKIEKVFKI